MRLSYDAIVLGAGIAGLSVARELAKLNERVLLLEREKVGGEASRAAAGILDPYTEADEETPLLRLGLKALESYPSFLEELEKTSRIDVEYERLGTLYLALTPEDETLLKDRLEWQRRCGLPVEVLSPEAVHKIEPDISSHARGGFFYPEIPKLNAEKLTSALFKATGSAGVEIKTSVKDVTLWLEGGKVRGVRISRDSVESPQVILAKGCWAGLDEMTGIKIKVSPVRGQILILRSPPPFSPKHIVHTLRGAYLVPWPGGRLLIGSTLESAGFDNRVTPEGKEDILNRVSEIFDRIRELPIEASWSGLRPFAERGLPLVGPTRVSGLFIATGYYRSGIIIGPLVGKLLAEGIVSGIFSPLLEPFYPK